MLDSSLNNHLVSVFYDPYLSTLKISYTWYATKTTLELIHHIYTHYALISFTYMAAKDERLSSPYNAEETLEGLINRLNEYADITVAASKPVSETQLVRITYRLIADMVQYPEYCRTWRTQDNKS